MQSIGNPNNRAAIFNGQLPSIGNPAVAGRIALARAMQQNPVQVGPQGPQAAPAQPSAPPLTPYNPQTIGALQAPQTGPVQHPLEALARALMPVAGNYQQGQNMVAERGQKEAQMRALSQAVAAARGGDPAGALNTPNLPPEMLAILAGQAMQPPPKPSMGTVYGDDGVGRYGELQPGVRTTAPPKPEAAAERPRVQQNGVWYYTDTGEKVLPNAASAPEGEALKPTELFSQTNAVSNAFRQQAAPFVDVRDSYRKIEQAAAEPSPAGDMALVYSYMKMMDPGSVVREQEFQSAAQAGSFGTQVQAAVNRIATGQLMTPEQRADFIKQARGIMQQQLGSHRQLELQYSDRAAREGLDPRNVVVDYTAGGMLDNLPPQQPSAPPPAAGGMPQMTGDPARDEAIYNAVPVGGVYRAPDGTVRTKGQR